MTYNLNHVHLKSLDPGKTANWWVDNFNFEIVADSTRDTGDRFIRCRAENGVPVSISGPLSGQTLPENDAGVKLGLDISGSRLTISTARSSGWHDLARRSWRGRISFRTALASAGYRHRTTCV